MFIFLLEIVWLDKFKSIENQRVTSFKGKASV